MTFRYAALTYTEYPLRILKFEMNGAGLVQNDVFSKALRMLADPYKFLKNVAIDCHAHYRILENALRMFRTLTNAVTNNTNVLQTPYK